METSQFVDQALEDRKMDIAKSMFGGQEIAADDQVDIEVLDANEINGVRMGDIEVQDTEDTEA